MSKRRFVARPVQGEFDVELVEAWLLDQPFSARDPAYAGRSILVNQSEGRLDASLMARRRKPPRAVGAMLVTVDPERIQLSVGSDETAAKRFLPWLHQQFDVRWWDEWLNEIPTPLDDDVVEPPG